MSSLHRIASAVVRCWLSTTGIALVLLTVFDGPAALAPELSLRVVGLTTLSTVAYGLTLWLARHNFRDDAQLGGRRDFIAGILAIVVLLAASVVAQGASPGTRLALCFLAGSLAAVLMYFPWLQPRSAQEAVRLDA